MVQCFCSNGCYDDFPCLSYPLRVGRPPPSSVRQWNEMQTDHRGALNVVVDRSIDDSQCHHRTDVQHRDALCLSSDAKIDRPRGIGRDAVATDRVRGRRQYTHPRRSTAFPHAALYTYDVVFSYGLSSVRKIVFSVRPNGAHRRFPAVCTRA